MLFYKQFLQINRPKADSKPAEEVSESGADPDRRLY